MQGGHRPIHATALSHWRRSWAGADTCKNGLNCGSFCVCFLAGSYARAGARRSARLGVCARVFLAPPPGQESFGRYCVRPRAPSYARKIPASEFQAQEGHRRPQAAPPFCRCHWYPPSSDGSQRGHGAPRRPAAAPPPCRCPGIRPALAAPGGATVRPGDPQRLRRPAGAGIRPALTATGGATVRPGGPQRLRRAVGCLGIYPVPTARRGGKKFPLLFPFTRFLTLWTRYHEIPRRR